MNEELARCAQSFAKCSPGPRRVSFITQQRTQNEISRPDADPGCDLRASTPRHNDAATWKLLRRRRWDCWARRGRADAGRCGVDQGEVPSRARDSERAASLAAIVCTARPADHRRWPGSRCRGFRSAAACVCAGSGGVQRLAPDDLRRGRRAGPADPAERGIADCRARHIRRSGAADRAVAGSRRDRRAAVEIQWISQSRCWKRWAWVQPSSVPTADPVPPT